MALDPQLRNELAAILAEVPLRIELAPTGELLLHEAMELARFYHGATVRQRAALDAVRNALTPS